MTTSNPYADDPDKASAFEVGYLWGFTHSDEEDNPPPYSPDLLEIYLQGVDSGKEDRGRSPDGGAASSWVPRAELEDDSDWIGGILIHLVAELLKHAYRKAVFGLVGLVIGVLEIPTDTPLKSLPDDFEEPYEGPESNSDVSYIATCARDDHPLLSAGTTSEGYWMGSAYSDFGAALKEAVAHEHAEALVARCSLAENSCGVVWAAR
ncbi:hypothetical protein [Streptomyces lydicus]|uniref:hypothetical protein n=1 Tax=Streptomyces lydicus TaxID=47763 RepID=UPI00131DFED4|nr:hypothetical protein [Streptomyces lydicus]